MREVCIVIPNWNGWKDTIECLNSLVKIEDKEKMMIIVVDNASTNESVDKLKIWAKDNLELGEFLFLKEENTSPSTKEASVVLIEKEENNGFAGAVNAGLKYGLEHQSCEYYWILNNDTIVDKYALSELLKFAKGREDLGVLGNTIVEYFDPSIIQCAGGCYYNKYLTINHAYLHGEKVSSIQEHTQKKKFDYIHGASMFIPKKVLKQVGYLNEEYFLYYEELDLVERVKKLNLSLYWCKKSIIQHKGGGSAGTKSAANPKKSALSEYYSNLSALKYTSRYYPLQLPLVAINRFFLKVALFVIKKEWGLFRVLWSSYFNFFTRKGNRGYQ